MKEMKFDASSLVASQKLHEAVVKKIGNQRAMLILQFAVNHNAVQKMIAISGFGKQEVIMNQVDLLNAIADICALRPERLCVALDAYMSLLLGIDKIADDWQTSMMKSGVQLCDMEDADAVQEAMRAYAEKNLNFSVELAAIERGL